MAKFDQFGSVAPGAGGGGSRDCLRYEAMLADVIDGTLSAEDQAAFDRHRETCDSCSDMLKDARRGAAWLEMLKPHRPEPSAALVTRILAETSVRTAQEAEAVRVAQRAAAEAASLLGPARPSSGDAASPAFPNDAVPEIGGGKVLPFRNRLPAALRPVAAAVLQTRFAMTAAMAFFSVALTLNLTGVHLADLHARDLRPASLRRSFYEANAHVVRYYENLRVVYELESRVRDLQHSGDTDSTPASTRPAAEAPDAAPPTKPGSFPATPSAKPVGKPHSGLSSGSESRGRNPLSGGRETDAGMAGRRSTEWTPHGAILPVSLSTSLPDRQIRGLA